MRADDFLNKEWLAEDWQKVNKHDKTDGMSGKAVKAYRRENPGSKLKTAVTTKPSKLKKGSKSAKRRKSFCARMSGMKKAHASAKTKRDPDSPINKALRRWNCESIEEMQTLIHLGEQYISSMKQLTESITPNNIHKLANAKGIKWDDEPSFLKLTKRLTGREHLDDLDQAGLKKVKQYIEKQGVSEGEGGLGQVAGIGINGKQFNFSIKDLIAKAQNYPIKKLNPQLFVKQLANRHEDPKQTAARAQVADLQYPIIVVQDGNTLMIADGTHRAQKAIMNKLPTINAHVIPVKDMAEFSKKDIAESLT
jgi:hypothetical protein